MSFGPPRSVPANSTAYIRNQIAEGTQFVTKMEKILETLRTNLTAARNEQEKYANASREAAPAYKVGDYVYLNRRNIKTTKPSLKLDHKWFGKFKILQVLGSHAYKLELLFKLQEIDNSFHTSLLRPAKKGLLYQTNPAPPPIAVDESGRELWAIEEILKSRRRRKTKEFEYYIKWRGYGPEHNSWEPLLHMVDATTSIKMYENKYPKRPKPTKEERDAARAKAQQQDQPSRDDLEDLEMPGDQQDIREDMGVEEDHM